MYTLFTMSGSKNPQQLSRKAFEIAYAAFRVCSSLENRVFVEHLEAWSLSLLEAVTALSEDKAHAAILNLEYLVSLARDLNFLNSANSDIFLNEIKGMNAAMIEYFATSDSDIDLTGMFSDGLKVSSDFSNQKGKSDETMEGESMGSRSGGQAGGNFVNSAIRKSAIVDKIRQNKVCRLRDLQEVFPDASERTIRYDVQNLIEQGVLERIGNGGPATAYRLKQEIAPELPAASSNLI